MPSEGPNRHFRARASAAGAVALLVLAAGLRASADHATAAGPVGASKGAFHADCLLSHRASDDPIVFRRGPGASHRHDFFGSRSTNAFSTNRSLRRAPTNCIRTNSRGAGRADRSAYWVPTLYVHGRPVAPTSVGAYYSTGFRDLASIEPFPPDLRVIAGDSRGAPPTDRSGERVIAWSCEGREIVAGSSRVAPTCGSRLRLNIRFPDCWNGAESDSRDHKSHMAYSRQARSGNRRRVCPGSHPKQVPVLQLGVGYPTGGGPSVLLASGTIDTAHADFMNGWDKRKLAKLVRLCLRKDRYCGGGDRPVPGH